MNYLCIILWSSWKEPTEDDFGCLSLYICRYLFTLCYIQVPRWRADGVEPGCPAVRHGVRQPALAHPVTDTRQAALLARSGPLTPAQGQWPPSPSSPSHRYSPNSSPGQVVTSHPSSRSVTSHTQLKVSDLSPQLKVNDLSPQLKEIFVLNFLFTKHINVPRIDTFLSDYPLKASREHATVKKCPDSAKLFAHAIISTISKPYAYEI